jgi:hypothetical protein
MSQEVTDVLRVLGVAAGLGLLLWLGVKLVRGAKRGKGLPAAGALLMLFGWGNLRDPRNDTVAEANEGQPDRGESTGDPVRRNRSPIH